MVQVEVTTKIKVNGQAINVSVEPRELLLDVLRDKIGLTGPKKGCDESVCGCCAVLLDGRAICSCSVLALEAEGHEITTIDGLALGPSYQELDSIQRAFIERDAMQCGFCTSGQIIAAKNLLENMKHEGFHDLTQRELDQRIKEGLSGNLCRCGCYNNIVAAVRDAISNVATEGPLNPIGTISRHFNREF